MLASDHPGQKFGYVSSAVSLFSLDGKGKLFLLNATAATEAAVSSSTSSFANDSWSSPDGKYLYQDYAGDDQIVAYSISANGALTKLGEQPVNTQSKISLQGLTGTGRPRAASIDAASHIAHGTGTFNSFMRRGTQCIRPRNSLSRADLPPARG